MMLSSQDRDLLLQVQQQVQDFRTETRSEFREINDHLRQLNGSVSRHDQDIAVLQDRSERSERERDRGERRQWTMWGMLSEHKTEIGILILLVLQLWR